MAQLPTGYQLSGPVSLRSGRTISSADESAIGRGMASLGGAVADAGASLKVVAEKQRQKQNTIDLARANAFQDQSNVDLLNQFDQDPDYASFGVRAPKKASEIAATAASMIRDPEVRKLWEIQAGTTAKKTADAVVDKGFQLSQQADLVAFDEALETQRRLYIDPNTPDEAKDKARASLEGAIEVGLGSGLLTPEAALRYRKAYLDGSDFERAKLDTSIVDPREAYFDAIRSAESGGDDSAANSKSSARGRYQFLRSTWDELSVRHPNAGLTKNGRFDPVQQEKAIRLFTAENEAALAKAGIPATNGSLYAAHFLGAGGAVDVLKAPDGAALEGLLSKEVITANPFLKGMTVGRFKEWANDKGGGVAGVPAYIERLPADQRQAIFDMRAAEHRQALTAAVAQQKVEYEQHRSGLELGVLTGDVVSEQQVLTDPVLDDNDKAELIRSLRSEQKSTADAQALLTQIGNGTASLNPYNADNRTAAGKAYDLMVTSVPEEQRSAATATFVQETGIVPAPVVADVRLKLNSTNPADVAAGMSQAAALYDVAPQGLDAVEHGKEVREAASTYDELVNGRGLTVEQAAQQVINLRNPDQKAREADLDTAWQQLTKEGTFKADDVLAEFDGGFLVGRPASGVTPAQSAALTADYLEAAERAFYGPANGDPGIAKKIAVDEMKRTYGVSSVSGNRSLMKYPPENFYPALNGDQTYIRELALKDARTLEAGTQNVMLVPTDETSQDIRGGTMPRYNLMYQREDGVWDIAPDMFTLGDEMAELMELASQERQVRFEMARERSVARQDVNAPIAPVFTPPDFLVDSLLGEQPGDAANNARLAEIEAQRNAIYGKTPGAPAAEDDVYRRMALEGMFPEPDQMAVPQ